MVGFRKTTNKENAHYFFYIASLIIPRLELTIGFRILKEKEKKKRR